MVLFWNNDDCGKNLPGRKKFARECKETELETSRVTDEKKRLRAHLLLFPD
jgi:hypothetical protein